MIKIRKRKKISPINLLPGDTFELMHNEDTLLKESITVAKQVDEIGVFEFKNEFGLKEGFGGFFGKRK